MSSRVYNIVIIGPPDVTQRIILNTVNIISTIKIEIIKVYRVTIDGQTIDIIFTPIHQGTAPPDYDLLAVYHPNVDASHCNTSRVIHITGCMPYIEAKHIIGMKTGEIGMSTRMKILTEAWNAGEIMFPRYRLDNHKWGFDIDNAGSRSRFCVFPGDRYLEIYSDTSEAPKVSGRMSSITPTDERDIVIRRMWDKNELIVRTISQYDDKFILPGDKHKKILIMCDNGRYLESIKWI